MMNKDKISIIVPCYNVSDYLLNCFDYIKKQTYGFDNLEVIFVDDISSDNTWNLLESLRNDYPNNVKIFKLDKKGNSGGARNKGIDNCSGKYLTFVDADDFIHPMMLEIFYKQMLIDDYDIVQNESFMYFGNLPKLKEINDYKVDAYDLNDVDARKKILLGLTKDLNLTVWGKLYKTSFVKGNNLKFIENRYFEDNHFTLMCSLLANKFCKVHAPLYGYYNNTNGTILKRLNFDKIHNLELVIKAALKEIKIRKLDEGVALDCKDELANFIFYKMYIETTTNLEKAYKTEKEYYKNEILEILPNISENKYVKKYKDEDTLNKIEDLKSI